MPLPRAVRNEHHEQCLQVYELAALRPELSQKKLGRKLGLNPASVSYWLRHERFSPYIDEIALERALEGNRSAYDGLTLWERDLFWDRLQAQRMSMGHKAWMDWVHVFAGRLGMEGGDIGDRLYKRYGAGFKGRPAKLHTIKPPQGQVLIRRRDRFGRRRFI